MVLITRIWDFRPPTILLASILAFNFLLATQDGAQDLAHDSNETSGKPTVYVTQSQTDGTILRLGEMEQSKSSFSVLLKDQVSPENIAFGPDARLYFNEIGAERNSVNRIWRFDLANSSRQLVAEWRTDALRPSAMLFGPDGDLFFGTVSVAASQPTEGIWRIRGAASAGQTFGSPEQVLPGDLFPPIPGSLAAVNPGQFLAEGPFKGDLLVIYEPNFFLESGSAVRGDVFRLLKPTFSSREQFMPSSERHPFAPASVATRVNGDVLITDSAKGQVLEFTPTGSFRRVFAKLDHANQITVDSYDVAYVTNAFFNDRGIVQGGLFMYGPNGKLLQSATSQAMLRGITVGIQPVPVATAGARKGEAADSSVSHTVNSPRTTIIAAIIGGISTILGAIASAIITYFLTKKSLGEHSVLRFLKIYRKDLGKAMRKSKKGAAGNLYPICMALVENVKTWRNIQRGLAPLLNGLIDELEGAIKSQDSGRLSQLLEAINDAFNAKEQAVRTELERSRI